ncbi:pyridoxal phosphate-dependent aminotransferase, partial [Streptomyces seoulensis]
RGFVEDLGHEAHVLEDEDLGAVADRDSRGFDDNRRLLTDLLAEHLPAIRCRPGRATYLAWLDCRALGLGDDPAQVFLERGRVALSSGPPFGEGGAGHARLNLGTSPELLTEAVRRMTEAVR